MYPPRLAFIGKVEKDIVESCKGTGLLPSVMIAQACLESSNGESSLSVKHNNFFGIKAPPGWSGSKVAEYPTTEYVKGKAITVQAKFRSYDSMLLGFAGRIKFLQENERYTRHGVFSSKSSDEQVKALVSAGYATDPKYFSLVTDIIKEYSLDKYNA